MIFYQPAKNDQRTYDNIRKIWKCQGDDDIPGCLLDCLHFKYYYKVIAIYFSQQQALDADVIEIQQITFTRNLDRVGDTTMVLIIEEAKEKVLDISQGTVKVLWIYSALVWY